jgi:hypothetical protein
MSEPIRIVLQPVGRRWRVYFNGAVLIERARDPEHQAARALLAQGNTGPAESWHWNGSAAAMTLDIETAAGLTIREEDVGGLKVRKWQSAEDMRQKQVIALKDGDLHFMLPSPLKH